MDVMKYILPLIFVFLGIKPILANFDVDQIEIIPTFDVNFLLTNSEDDRYYINLNCQSFFQKLDFYAQDGSLLDENYITIQECEQVYLNTLQCLETDQHKCLDPNDFLNPNCDC